MRNPDNDNDMKTHLGTDGEFEAAVGGCANSQYLRGIQMLQSASGPSCFSEAMEWLTAAARQGHREAGELLAKLTELTPFSTPTPNRSGESSAAIAPCRAAS